MSHISRCGTVEWLCYRLAPNPGFLAPAGIKALAMHLTSALIFAGV